MSPAHTDETSAKEMPGRHCGALLPLCPGQKPALLATETVLVAPAVPFWGAAAWPAIFRRYNLFGGDGGRDTTFISGPYLP